MRLAFHQFACFLTAVCVVVQAGDSLSSALPPADTLRNRPGVAVFDFRNSNALARESGYGQTIAAMLTTYLRNSSNFLVVERSELAAVVDEVKLQQSGLTGDLRREIGAFRQVDAVLVGDVSCLGSTIQIDARLIEIRSGDVVAAEYGIANDVTEIRKVVAGVAGRIEMTYLRPLLGSLEVLPTNVDAETYLDGVYRGTASPNKPLLIERLLQGEYRLKLIAGGYIDYEEIVVVQSKMVRQVKVSLRVLPGSMTITSEPPGATVSVDNNEMGVTPLVLDEVAEGEHQILLALANYRTWSKDVVVKSSQPTNVKATLEVKPGVLQVRSTAAPASVYIKGNYVGTCPLRLENMPPGEIAVRVSAPGCKDLVQSVKMQANSEVVIDADLSKMKGKLNMTSNPPGASVTVARADGSLARALGKTPLWGYDIDIGDYVVSMSMPTYYPASQTVSVASDVSKTVTLGLTQKPGIVAIEEPRNAKVYINSAYKGRCPITVHGLAQGTYALTLESPDMLMHDSVTVLADTVTTFSRKLPGSRSSLISGLSFVFLTLLAGILL